MYYGYFRSYDLHLYAWLLRSSITLTKSYLFNMLRAFSVALTISLSLSYSFTLVKYYILISDIQIEKQIIPDEVFGSLKKGDDSD